MTQLRKIAADLDISGRSKMNKGDLHSAIVAALDILRSEAEMIMAEESVMTQLFPSRKPGTPMTAAHRIDVYTAQRNGGKLTARQRRRIGRKALHYGAKCGMISKPAKV